jgi:hypothetical protein
MLEKKEKTIKKQELIGRAHSLYYTLTELTI